MKHPVTVGADKSEILHLGPIPWLQRRHRLSMPHLDKAFAEVTVERRELEITCLAGKTTAAVALLVTLFWISPPRLRSREAAGSKKCLTSKLIELGDG